MLEEADWAPVEPGVEAKIVAHPNGAEDEVHLLCRPQAHAQKRARLERRRQRLRDKVAEIDASQNLGPLSSNKKASQPARKIPRPTRPYDGESSLPSPANSTVASGSSSRPMASCVVAFRDHSPDNWAPSHRHEAFQPTLLRPNLLRRKDQPEEVLIAADCGLRSRYGDAGRDGTRADQRVVAGAAAAGDLDQSNHFSRASAALAREGRRAPRFSAWRRAPASAPPPRKRASSSFRSPGILHLAAMTGRHSTTAEIRKKRRFTIYFAGEANTFLATGP